ncbi:MAG: NAD(P)-dependent oxidoreductase [Woeseiaceae bacterium]|nr:NAD(P)-dependent oxidoreductase [Woeseiaceae bacterium]
MKVGFIGLGRMGQGIAGRIRSAGHDMLVFDPAPGQTESLVKAGAAAVDSVASVTAGREVVVSMLPSDEALRSVLDGEDGLLVTMPADCVHMAMGTHGIMAIDTATRLHEAAGQHFVACPVLGRPNLAAEGLLNLIPAGSPDAVGRVRPLFDVIGKQTFEVGSEPRVATTIKVASNFMLGCAIEAMGEAINLVEKLDVDPSLFLDVTLKGLFGAPAYETYGRMIVDKAWQGHGATAVIGLKDAELALEAARLADMTLPSTYVWRDYLKAAIERGDGKLDWAVMAREHARDSGLGQ